MRYILLALCLCACESKSADELGDMTKAVLKAKEGIDIQIKPLQEEKGQSIVNKSF